MSFKLFVLAAVLVIVQAGVLPHKDYHHEGPMEAVAETKEHVVRNYAGTVATQSKAIHTPYASVHKQDTRITNKNNYNKYASSGIDSAYASYEPQYNYHAHAHTTEAPAATYHHETSTFHHEAPTYNHAATVHHQVAPVHHQEAPAYHHETPNYHHEAPTYHHETPVHHQATPVHYQAASVHHHEVPSYHHETPVHHQETPVYHHEVPIYHQNPTTTAAPGYHHEPATHAYKHNDHAISEYGSNQKVHYSPANMVSHMSFDGFGTHWGF